VKAEKARKNWIDTTQQYQKKCLTLVEARHLSDGEDRRQSVHEHVLVCDAVLKGACSQLH